MAAPDMGRKLGNCAPLVEGRWVPIEHNVARAEAYLHAKFHLDPSNRLATVHQRHRQTDRKTDRQTDGQTGDNGPIAYGEPFYKGSPKNIPYIVCPSPFDGLQHR